MAASFSLTHQPKLSISSPIHKNMIFARSQNHNSFVNITSPTKINHNQKQIIMHPLLWCNSSSSSFSPRIITALNSSPMEDQNTSKEQTAEDIVKNLEEVLDDKMEKDFKTVLEQVYSDDYEGSLVQDGLIFRQNFPIRSYEIGADRTASIETLMNHLQETALNHVKSAGLIADGFGSTPEMCKRNLIWVVTRMQVLVDRYPTWGDKVQVDTWVRSSGNNGYGMCRDWLIRDCNTGEILTRASSVWVMMNKQTRRWSKMPDEVRAEIGPYFVDTPPVFEEDGRKLEKLDDKTAEHIRPNLTPRWNDLDVNQHVNNVKYIGLILESAPQSILESHELSSMTLEYRKECGRDNVLQSLTAVTGPNVGGLQDYGNVECLHLLRNEEGAQVVRGRTEWRPKHAKNFGELDQVPAGA